VADRLTTDELLAAASDAFRGNRTAVQSILDGVKERAGARAREALDQRLSGAIGGSGPAASSSASRALPVLRTTTANERALLDEIAHQRKVTRRLERESAELSARVEKIEKRTDQALMGVVEGLGQFKRQAGRAGTAAEVAALQQATQLQQVSSVVASVQSAAYGERGSVLSNNNLLLAANQLVWIFAGPALQRLGIMSGATAQLIASLAPIGSLITGGLTLGRSQHVRFVSGVTSFFGTQRIAIETLRNRIAEADWEEFSKRTDIPVSVTTVSGEPFNGSAAVQNGVLVITLPPPGLGFILLEGAPSARVAWMVDTGADGG